MLHKITNKLDAVHTKISLYSAKEASVISSTLLMQPLNKTMLVSLGKNIVL